MTEEGKIALKDAGMEILEEHLKRAISDIYLIAGILAKDSESKVDDGIVAAAGMLKGTFEGLAEQINPKD